MSDHDCCREVAAERARLDAAARAWTLEGQLAAWRGAVATVTATTSTDVARQLVDALDNPDE